MTADPFHIGEGDLSPSITRTLIGDDGQPVDLSGCTVTFNMATGVNSSVVQIAADAVIVDAVAGIVRYDWQGNNTGAAGAYVADFLITLPSGKTQRVPNEAENKIPVYVEKSIG